MTTAYTSLLGLALPVTGELSGTWGDTVNNSITSLLDSAVAGTTTLSTDADVTLTTTTGAANTAREAILLCTGARTGIKTITAPAQSKIYTVINSTTGGYSVKVVGAGPTTGLTIPNGSSAVIAWNGSDFIEVGSSTVGNFTVNGNLTVTGTSTLTGAITNTAGTANGVAYLNGSKVLTTGSGMIFDGLNFGVGTAALTNFGGSFVVSQTSGASGGYALQVSGGVVSQVAADSTASVAYVGTRSSHPLVFTYGNTEQMRLTSTGLGIGTSSPGYKLEVAGSTAVKYANPDVTGIVLQATTGTNAAAMKFINTGGNGYIGLDNSAGSRIGSNAAYSLNMWHEGAYPIVFGTNNTERARIDSSGNLFVGATALTSNANYFATSPGNAFSDFGHVTGVATATPYTRFLYAGGVIGSITQSGTTAVLYNVTSDQRLKENIQDAEDAATLIDAIQVRQYDWKSDGSHQRYGFVAQELVTVAPEAVHQPADPDDMMAVDYSKLVPMLVKEIQSLRKRLTALEGKA